MIVGHLLLSYENLLTAINDKIATLQAIVVFGATINLIVTARTSSVFCSLIKHGLVWGNLALVILKPAYSAS